MIKVGDWVYIKDIDIFGIPETEKCLVIHHDGAPCRPVKLRVANEFFYGTYNTFWFNEEELELTQRD